MYTNIILYIVTCIFSTAFSLNLTLTDYHDPVANHILDAEVINDILIISAMVQGIEFYDISDPQSLNHLTNFTLSSGGGWGNNAKSNCVRAINNYAYFTSNNGVYIVNISNPSNPQSLGAISGTTNLNLENLDINGNYLAKTVKSIDIGLKTSDVINKKKLLLSLNIIFPDKNFYQIEKKIERKKFFYLEK